MLFSLVYVLFWFISSIICYTRWFIHLTLPDTHKIFSTYSKCHTTFSHTPFPKLVS